MLLGVIISVSIALQFLSVFFSLRLIKTTGFRVSWLFISMSILLMGIRRVIALYDLFVAPGSTPPGYTYELVGLITSGLMLVGVIMIGPLFESMRQNEKKLKDLSITDELTGLNNRRGLTAFTERFIAMADREKTGFYLLYADLDGMKAINDTSGHQEGDRMLIATANILKKTFRHSDIVARVGGDEFVVVPIIDDVDKVIDRLQKNIDKFNSARNGNRKLSLSFGVSCYNPESPCSIEDLLFGADKLMYEQKEYKRHQRDA